MITKQITIKTASYQTIHRPQSFELEFWSGITGRRMPCRASMSIFGHQIAAMRLRSVQSGCDTASRHKGFMEKEVIQRELQPERLAWPPAAPDVGSRARECPGTMARVAGRRSAHTHAPGRVLGEVFRSPLLVLASSPRRQSSGKSRVGRAQKQCRPSRYSCDEKSKHLRTARRHWHTTLFRRQRTAVSDLDAAIAPALRKDRSV